MESIEQCVWADNKFYNRNMQVLHTKYKLYSNCTIGENFITNSFGEKFLVNRFLIDFLYEINHCNKTIIQIIEDSIVEQLDENCELEIADAIDYLYCHHILKKKKEEY